jgi:hypothetical protein
MRRTRTKPPAVFARVLLGVLLALLVLLGLGAARVGSPPLPGVPVPAGPGVDAGWLCCRYSEIARLHPTWWVDYTGVDSPADGPGHVYMTWAGDPSTALHAWAAAHPGHAWILGNEPNVPGQDACGTPAQCGALWRSQMAAIRTADPRAVFRGPGLGNADLGYAQQLVEAGADGFAAWNIHFYPPANDPYNSAPLVAAVQAFQGWLASRGDRRPLILGEWGVPPGAHDAAGAERYLQASGPGCGRAAYRHGPGSRCAVTGAGQGICSTRPVA